MKLTNQSDVPVYTISGSNTARPLPEWLARKRKRSLKQDPEYANRVELLQDFEFEEASQCIRISEDGDWVVSTGTYKPQMHIHNLPQLSLSYARHTDSLNQTFQLLSSDYSKSLHLQSDRFVEFHTPSGRHYSTRLPRYGRDLVYDRHSAEALIPSVGLNPEGNGEVFRLNLEVGRFMRAYEVDVGGDDDDTHAPPSANGGRNRAIQGKIDAGSVDTAAIAEESHNLLAFGTSLGSVELWDPRSRRRAAVLPPPSDFAADNDFTPRASVSCLQFHHSGLTLATGSSTGLIHLYDLRSPTPLLKKDQGYGYPIQNLTFLTSSTTSSQTAHLQNEPKILSADKRIIKLWDARDGSPWTSVEPAVDLHDVAWYPSSGMLLTANEGSAQHSFFIPQLGPAPKWCRFLDNMVEEMAEDDASASHSYARKPGEIYDNYRFVSVAELRSLNLDHQVERKPGVFRPYMHGYFIPQGLYEDARVLSNPDVWRETREKSIKERVAKERESRIRGVKTQQQQQKSSVKVNKALAERMVEREQKNQERKRKREHSKREKAVEAGDRGTVEAGEPEANAAKPETANGEAHDPHTTQEQNPDQNQEHTQQQPDRPDILTDPRFRALFRDESYAIDETSAEYKQLNAGSKIREQERKWRQEQEETARGDGGGGRSGVDGEGNGARNRLTAVERDELDRANRRHAGSSETNSSGDSDSDSSSVPSYTNPEPSTQRLHTSATRKQKHQKHPQKQKMHITTSTTSTSPPFPSNPRDPSNPRSTAERKTAQNPASRSFADRLAETRTRSFGKSKSSGGAGGGKRGGLSGDRSVTFSVGGGGGGRGGGRGRGERGGRKGHADDRAGGDGGEWNDGGGAADGRGGDGQGGGKRRAKDRRSASGNIFRRM
ncbi:MAG: hypothetical protein M1831_001384 [Alyxoria varia]|nr:MAG: hypothetical protein M1831_001384 [Alyxoria varia]